MVPGKDGNKIMGGVWERVNGKSLSLVSQEGLGRGRV